MHRGRLFLRFIESAPAATEAKQARESEQPDPAEIEALVSVSILLIRGILLRAGVPRYIVRNLSSKSGIRLRRIRRLYRRRLIRGGWLLLRRKGKHTQCRH
jgi:hypothetical protein